MEATVMTEELAEEFEQACEYVPEDAVRAYLDNIGAEYFIASAVEDAYAGCWRDGEEYATDLLEQTGGLEKLPENLRHYFDYAALYRDMKLGGDVWEADAGDGEVWIFRNI